MLIIFDFILETQIESGIVKYSFRDHCFSLDGKSRQ